MVLDTKAEQQVLADLMEYPGWVFTKEQNYQTVYQEQAESIVNVVIYKGLNALYTEGNFF